MLHALPLSLLASQRNQRQLAASVRELLDERGQEPGKARAVLWHDAIQCDSIISGYLLLGYAVLGCIVLDQIRLDYIS